MAPFTDIHGILPLGDVELIPLGLSAQRVIYHNIVNGKAKKRLLQPDAKSRSVEIKMSHIESLISTKYAPLENLSVQRDKAQPLVVVVEDGSTLFEEIEVICDFLDLGIERVSAADRLLEVLDERRPMAVVAELDGARQDGCFVLMTVAAHDRNLPVLMVTGKDSALAGAVDAVEELWGLGAVVKAPVLPRVGGLVDFLFRAGRRAGVSRLVPV